MASTRAKVAGAVIGIAAVGGAVWYFFIRPAITLVFSPDIVFGEEPVTASGTTRGIPDGTVLTFWGLLTTAPPGTPPTNHGTAIVSGGAFYLSFTAPVNPSTQPVSEAEWVTGGGATSNTTLLTLEGR